MFRFFVFSILGWRLPFEHFLVSSFCWTPSHQETFTTSSDVRLVWHSDGSLRVAGNPLLGGFQPSHIERLSQVEALAFTHGAVAAVCFDGSVLAWGHRSYGGTVPAVLHGENVRKVYSTAAAFAVICRDGSVVTWGHDQYGGDSRLVQEKLKDVAHICGTCAEGSDFEEGGRGRWNSFWSSAYFIMEIYTILNYFESIYLKPATLKTKNDPIFYCMLEDLKHKMWGLWINWVPIQPDSFGPLRKTNVVTGFKADPIPKWSSIHHNSTQKSSITHDGSMVLVYMLTSIWGILMGSMAHHI